MKKTFFFLLLLLSGVVGVSAQVGQATREWRGGSAPSGSCPSGAPNVVYNGSTYYCNTGTGQWSKEMGGSSADFMTDAYAVPSDGTTDARAALNTLVNTTMQSGGGRLVLGAGTYRVASNLTIPVNVQIDPGSMGKLKPDSGVTITVLSAIPAEARQFFDVSASGATGINLTGNYIVQWVYPEWFGGSPAASAATNMTPMRAAFYAAFGSSRTNGSGDSKYNRGVWLSGLYDINDEIKAYHMNGGRVSGFSKLWCGIRQTTASKRIFDGQSLSYFTVDNVYFDSTAVQANNALIELDYSGAQGEDLRPQNISFEDVVLHGNNVTLMGVWIAKSGGGAQGDNIRFDKCYGDAFTHSVVTLGGNGIAPLTGSSYATNAIMVSWDRGNISACPKYGLAVYGGSLIVDGVTMQNQVLGANGLPTQTGADFHIEGGANPSRIMRVRSEGLRLLEGDADVDDSYLTNWVKSWYDSNDQTTRTGTEAYVGQLVSGSLAGGDGKVYKVTRADAVTTGFLTITGLTNPNILIDSAASYVTNALVGLQVVVKFQSNGFVAFAGVVTANTATTITLNTTGSNYTTVDYTAGSTQYQVYYSIPLWKGVAKTTATSGSGTGSGATITKTSAGWTTNAHAGWRASIVSGTGKTQWGIIASNTSDTITLDATGWRTDYPLNFLSPSYAIVAADNTSQFVVEPNWGTQTTSGTDIEWVAYDYAAIDGYVPGSTYHSGRITNVQVGTGALVKTGARQIEGLQVSRADWGGKPNIFNDGNVEVYWKDIRVIRERGYQQPLPWAPSRNGSTAPLGPTPNVQTFGSAWLTWNRGLFGGGPVVTDLGVGPGDDANANSATGKDVLAFSGNYWGKRSARGTNQAGLATNIAGGYSTGSGAGGDIGFYTSAAGASGDAVRVGTLRWKIDPSGHLLAGTDGAWSIGAAGANRPLDIFTAGKVSIGSTGTATATTGAATSNVQIGTVTSEALTTAAGAVYTLTLTNSQISAASRVFISLANGTNSAGTPVVGLVTPGSGSCTIEVRNLHASAAFNGTIKLSFLVF